MPAIRPAALNYDGRLAVFELGRLERAITQRQQAGTLAAAELADRVIIDQLLACERLGKGDIARTMIKRYLGR